MTIEVKHVKTEEWVKIPFDTGFKPLSWFSPFWRQWIMEGR